MKVADKHPRSIFKDIIAGIIIAMVSIPISMGYSAVAGLPVIYGLYGSLLPIVLYGLLTTSPRFVFGVDAAPAALVGGMLAAMGIASESETAIKTVPVLTVMVSIWLLIFYLFNSQRLVRFISHPVMGGFITGIGTTIILMQIPKLFGGTSGRGELIELISHIVKEASAGFNLLSFILGLGTVIIITVMRKLIPSIPMAPVMMLAGLLLGYFANLKSFGVMLLPEVPAGLPKIFIPDPEIIYEYGFEMLLPSLTIALVILSETLLATNNYAVKYDDEINGRREILAYSIANLSSAFLGSCPVNGSVSRSSIADQFGVKSQIMSISAGVSMLLVLLFATPFISYLPVPILTGIIISALISTLEFDLADKLRKTDKNEFFIFIAAFLTVVIFGTIYGVIVGIILSATNFIIKASSPHTEFIGYTKSDSYNGFYPINDTASVRPIKNVLIYRFTGALFYANINIFQKDIIDNVKDGTKVVIVDAAGLASIDVTAARMLLMIEDKLSERGIRFYLVGHVAKINDELRSLGARKLIDDGAVKRSISRALQDAGIKKPYETEVEAEINSNGFVRKYAEYKWAYGDEAERMLRNIAAELAEKYAGDKDYDFEDIRNDAMKRTHGHLDIVDMDEFLDMLEMQFAILYSEGKMDEDAEAIALEDRIIEYHIKLEKDILDKNDDSINRIIRHRNRREERFKKDHPDAYKKMESERNRYDSAISARDKRLADILKHRKD